MIAADLPTKRAFGRAPAPAGEFPAWRESFGTDAEGNDVPRCAECGREAPRDGLHWCRDCGGER